MQDSRFSKSQLCHFLIGAPGSGKSTIASDWLKQNPNLVWISTDRIRETLYGDANIQGSWTDVQSVVIQEIQIAIAAGRSVLYDATNVRRDWRMSFLQRFPEVNWIAWCMETSLEDCLNRNRSRDRQVPQEIIEQFYGWMETEPVQRSEGFVAVNTIPLKGGTLDWQTITQLITAVSIQA